LLEDSEEHVSRIEQEFSPTVESSKIHHIPTDFPSFQRILVAYDGMKMSKIALYYAAYISKISDSEIVLINIIKAHRNLINVLPVTIVTNLHKEEIDIAANHREESYKINFYSK
jgi:hypothetical protein